MTVQTPCVQYERLRPAQIVERREACPVAYLPIGTIEWHGEHNPVGLDTLKMHALLAECAGEIGGLFKGEDPFLFSGDDLVAGSFHGRTLNVEASCRVFHAFSSSAEISVGTTISTTAKRSPNWLSSPWGRPFP